MKCDEPGQAEAYLGSSPFPYELRQACIVALYYHINDLKKLGSSFSWGFSSVVSSDSIPLKFLSTLACAALVNASIRPF